jgi:monovalent cation:H+ antiporter-2, CPA2 family
MHPDLPLLLNIATALAYALVGGVLARRVGLPPIVGYLLAGVALGPFTPGFIGDADAIGQLAELGVIFLMFGVGLHFSFRDLWQVRDIAIPGATIQMALATGAGYLLTQAWGWTRTSSLLLGVAISVASTVVLLRGLMDNGLLETRHGRVAVGWLVFEDIATVIILVLLPAFGPASASGGGFSSAIAAVLKAATFVGLMLILGNRIVPWVLAQIVHTRSRELFILAALTVALGTALFSAYMFGVSLALGAFVAGVVVSESPYSHQVGADLLPFREAFAVLFFVSVGMLVNPAYLATHWVEVLLLSGLVIGGKALIALFTGMLFPHPPKTAIVVAAGLSQIGEFSFIVGQAGLSLGLLEESQYSLILAGALISITVNPFMFRLIGPTERALKRTFLWRWIDRTTPEVTTGSAHEPSDHVVIVGWGRVGRHITELLGSLDVPRLVVEADPTRIDLLTKQSVPTLFGDAANSEILQHARLSHARALVVTVSDDSAASIIVAAARRQCGTLPIIARAGSQQSAKQLGALGATEIVLPEVEGGIQVVRQTLLLLDFPVRQVHSYTEAIRRQQLERPDARDEKVRVLDQLVHAARDLEIGWVTLRADSTLAGHSLAAAQLRARTGASVVAMARDGELSSNPDPTTTLEVGDHLAVIGSPEQLAAVEAVASA